MRSALIAALVGAGLLLRDASRADEPCAEDVKRLCGGVQVGKGRVRTCLQQNEAKLTPACRAKQAEREAAYHAIVDEFIAACGLDAKKLCSEVQPGGGRVIACLIRQLDDLTVTCRADVERVQAALETIKSVRDACRADVARLCGDATDAGALVECLQANREGLSDACRSVDKDLAGRAAELVDAMELLSTQERTREALQILQGIESIAFSRSQVLFQFDSYDGFLGSANANRLLFNPQVVFGARSQFSLSVRAPVLSVYPYATDRPAQTGLGAIGTAFAWGFHSTPRVRQYLSLGLQWISPVAPPVGAAWAVAPSYAISLAVARPLSITGQVGWLRSFASEGYPELNAMLFEPIVVLNLPGRSFAVLDTRLGWDLERKSFLPVVKGIAGLYLDRRRSTSISAWYQRSLTTAAREQVFHYAVGTALAYFFDW